MTPLSNLHGRVLEYLIVEAITKIQPEAVLTTRAKNAQIRDRGKLVEIDSALLQELNLATNALLTKWLDPQFQLSQRPSITIDRLPDQNRTDVTDIHIFLLNDSVNLSIKHNHTALRHQRPGRTPVHCGYSATSIEMQQFKRQYQEITQRFILQAGQERVFANLPGSLIEQSLYTPVCNLVSQFINTHADVCASTLFEYLIGSKNYYKVIIDTRIKKLDIQHFNCASIHQPTALTATVSRQYVELVFNNEWQILMRLHTAARELKTSPSLKFDTKAQNAPLPSTIVLYP